MLPNPVEETKQLACERLGSLVIRLFALKLVENCAFQPVRILRPNAVKFDAVIFRL